MKATRGERLKNPKLRKFATEMRTVLIKEANKRLIGLYNKRGGSMPRHEYFINQERIKELQALIIKLHGERRVIRLKNPKLIKVRTGFRILLEYEWSKRMHELGDQESELIHKYHHDKLIDKAIYDAKFREIEDQLAASEKHRKASITSCASCGDMEKDHVFVPQIREWYCEECLEFLEKKDYFEVMENWENFYKDIYE